MSGATERRRFDWWRIFATSRPADIHSRNVVGAMVLMGGREMFVGYCRKGDRR